jgi:hypothetical protein
MSSEDLVERLARLEGANRRMNRLTVASIIFAGLSILVAMTGTVQAQRGSRTIEAERFVLRNAKGVKIAEIGHSDDAAGPAMMFFDSNGELRGFYGGEVLGVSVEPTRIVTGPNGAHMRLARVIMDGSGLAFFDEGKSIISIGGSDSPYKPAQPKLELNENGKVIWSAP